MSFKVVWDDTRVSLTPPSGKSLSIEWADLRGVFIETNSLGPFAEDVHWLLATDSGSLVIPQEAEGMQELLTRLQQLPGFDNKAVIEAMSSVDDQIFLVWKTDKGS